MNFQINGQNVSDSSIDLGGTYGFGVLASFSKEISVTSGKIDIVVLKDLQNPKLSAFSIVYNGQ